MALYTGSVHLGRALTAARNEQLFIVFVTARPPRTVRARARPMGITGLAIYCNGAIVYDLDQDHITGHTPLTPEVARQLVLALREAIPGVCFAVELGVRYGWEPGFAALRPMVRTRRREWKMMPSCSAEPVTKLIVCHGAIHADELLRIAHALIGSCLRYMSIVRECKQ